MIETLMANFTRLFGKGGDIRLYFAPGRVNLIGEHIDYNGGHVFPCALQVGTYMVARKRPDTKLRFFSENISDCEIVERNLAQLAYDKKFGWTNYLMGVIARFAAHNMKIHEGLDIYCYGNIPGSGLSSSASMEVCTAVLLKDMFGFKTMMEKVAVYCQEAENIYNGLNCGIMDQFASAMGRKDQAIFLDCNKLTYRYVPLKMPGYKIVVTNSNKPHSLVTSHYNDRRKECDRALADFQKELDIRFLCELTPEEFEAHKGIISDATCLKRAKHAIYEEQRTKDAIEALQNNDILSFGKLVNESGDSLRYDYEATCPEIDFLVDEARKMPGVVGARIIGGGWGGNTLTIIKEENVKEFIKVIGQKYHDQMHLNASFAILEVGDGGRRIL